MTSSSDSKTPSFQDFEPSSEQASAAARGSSKKSDTKCEVKLRKALWHAGARYRKNVKSLPGKPDIVFPGPGLVVFCDGDFWHGKDWEQRKAQLKEGANAPYWLAKIERNRERDREQTQELEAEGWRVLRFWESDIHERTEAIVREVLLELERLDSERQKA